jgi:hypothetical protein
MAHITVKLHQKNFEGSELIKLNDARFVLERVLNSREFKLAVIGFTSKTRSRKSFLHPWVYRTQPGFLWNNRKSNFHVYNQIISGQDRFEDAEDKEVNIHITLDRRNGGSVIGYTYPSTRMTWIYESFFGRATAASIASNMMHEYCHNLGFGHPFKSTWDRQYSVPYGLGSIVKKLGDSLEG